MAGYVSPATQAAGAAIPTSNLNAYKAGLDALANPPVAHLYQSVSFTTVASSSTTWVAAAWDAAEYDSASGWSSGLSTWTCPTGWAGRYQFVAVGSYGAGTSGGRRFVAVGVNGLTPRTGSSRGPDNWADTNGLTVESSGMVFLNVGDTIQVLLMQSSGASISTRNAVSGAVTSGLYLRWVAAT